MLTAYLKEILISYSLLKRSSLEMAHWFVFKLTYDGVNGEIKRYFYIRISVKLNQKYYDTDLVEYERVCV